MTMMGEVPGTTDDGDTDPNVPPDKKEDDTIKCGSSCTFSRAAWYSSANGASNPAPIGGRTLLASPDFGPPVRDLVTENKNDALTAIQDDLEGISVLRGQIRENDRRQEWVIWAVRDWERHTAAYGPSSLSYWLTHDRPDYEDLNPLIEARNKLEDGLRNLRGKLAGDIVGEWSVDMGEDLNGRSAVESINRILDSQPSIELRQEVIEAARQAFPSNLPWYTWDPNYYRGRGIGYTGPRFLE